MLTVLKLVRDADGSANMIGCRRNQPPRNWLLRLGFAVLALTYGGLIFRTSIPAMPQQIEGTTEFEEYLINPRQSALNESAGKLTYLKHLKNSRERKENATLDEATLQLQKALASTTTTNKKKQKTNAKSSARKSSVRGYQEKMPQNELGIRLDDSPFNSTSLHESLKDFYNSIPMHLDNVSYIWDEPSVQIPQWMKRYLRWHHHVRFAISNNPSDLAGTILPEGKHLRFLVMHCMASDAHCGGVSDRLKPLPFILRNAYYSKRLLLIYWNRPGPLEEFLLPPRGGMDWRIPRWMEPQIKDQGYCFEGTYPIPVGTKVPYSRESSPGTICYERRSPFGHGRWPPRCRYFGPPVVCIFYL